jgi:Kinesin motor domain
VVWRMSSLKQQMPRNLASNRGELCLTQVKGLEEVYVRSAEDIYKLLDTGSLKRRTAATLLNKQSSRSHSVFCVTVQVSGMTVLPMSCRCCPGCTLQQMQLCQD